MNSNDGHTSPSPVDKNGDVHPLGILVKKTASFLKLLLSITVTAAISVLPFIQGARILIGNLHQGNFAVSDDCNFFEYFSAAQGISLVIIGLGNLLLGYLAVSSQSLRPTLIGILIALFASLFLGYGGCLHG